MSLSVSTDQDVTVDYATADDSATTSDNDYEAASGTLTIPAGNTSGTISITVNGDMTEEGDEQFFVNLSNPDGATLADDQGVGTIEGDDGTTSDSGGMYVWDTTVPHSSTSSLSLNSTDSGTSYDGSTEDYEATSEESSGVDAETVDALSLAAWARERWADQDGDPFSLFGAEESEDSADERILDVLQATGDGQRSLLGTA